MGLTRRRSAYSHRVIAVNPWGMTITSAGLIKQLGKAATLDLTEFTKHFLAHGPAVQSIVLFLKHLILKKKKQER